MKKLVYLSAIALAAVCCTKKFDEQAVKTILVPVTAEAGMETKTVMDVRDGASYINFAAGNQIGIWDGQSVMPLTTAEGGSRAIFTGELNMDEGGLPLTNTYYAVSPYVEGMTYSEGKFNITIPHNQVLTPNGFDPAAQFGYGSSSAGNLSFDFSNAVSFAKIVVNTTTEINLLGVMNTDGVVMAGDLQLNPLNGELTAAESGGWPSVQFNTVVPNGTYFLALRPGTYDNISFYAETSEGSKFCHLSASNVTFERNQIRYLANLTEDKLTTPGELVPAGTTLEAGTYIMTAAAGSGTIRLVKRDDGRFTVYQTGTGGTVSFTAVSVKVWESSTPGKVFVVLVNANGNPYAYMCLRGDQLHSYAKSSGLDAAYLEEMDGHQYSDGSVLTTKFSLYSID